MVTEEDSPGDSTSERSEKLLQRGKGKAQYGCDFVKGAGVGGEGRCHPALLFFLAEGFC